MELKDFDYRLPRELIAQYPLRERDASRLLVLDRGTGDISHRFFSDIKGCLRKGDLLILNDTKVVPSRITGRKETGGRVEFLLVQRVSDRPGSELWRCLAKPSRGLAGGGKVFFDYGITATVLEADAEGMLLCEFHCNGISPSALIDSRGHVPLPPYIKREDEDLDRARYQTVFAENQGAVAAPTAGLHFTDGLLHELTGMGVSVRFLTLHTGPGTFMPVREEDITRHRLPGECYRIGGHTFEEVKTAKSEGRRVVAVGTTAVRALESAARAGLEKPALQGTSGLFIYPGFEFRVVDALITNFHMPCSTLIMLASAFAGSENLMKAYRAAVKERYRFLSYGDAMFIF